MNLEIINELLFDEELGENRYLTYEEETIIFKCFKENPHLREDVQKILVKANLKLVHSIAKKYRPYLMNEYDDIVQLGLIGLTKAVDRFDITKNVKFSTYAHKSIVNNINKGLKTLQDDLNEPIEVSKLKKHYLETEETLVNELKREVTFNEIANKMGIAKDNLWFALSFSKVISLDEENSDKSYSLINKISSEDNNNGNYKLSEKNYNLIIDSFSVLNDQETNIVKQRYGFNDGLFHSFTDISKNLNISRQRVQYIEKTAINKMKKYIKTIEK